MTKRKAIEALLRQYDDDGSAENLADRAYEYGRIAGRGEAIAQLPSEGLIRAWDAKRKLRRYANALAKKARAK